MSVLVVKLCIFHSAGARRTLCYGYVSLSRKAMKSYGFVCCFCFFWFGLYPPFTIWYLASISKKELEWSKNVSVCLVPCVRALSSPFLWETEGCAVLSDDGFWVCLSQGQGQCSSTKYLNLGFCVIEACPVFIKHFLRVHYLLLIFINNFFQVYVADCCYLW